MISRHQDESVNQSEKRTTAWRRAGAGAIPQPATNGGSIATAVHRSVDGGVYKMCSSRKFMTKG